MTRTRNHLPPDSFAARLRAARDAAGLSAATVAGKMGVPLATYWNWEEGRRRPSVDQLVELAAAVRTKPEKLLA